MKRNKIKSWTSSQPVSLQQDGHPKKLQVGFGFVVTCNVVGSIDEVTLRRAGLSRAGKNLGFLEKVFRFLVFF